MELVYLWVEGYKNIHEEGFNFSPRFTCKYHKDSNELTIDENKDYISIFPENINVTAIVGENGSGKSSLLDLLPYGQIPKIIGNVIFFLFKKDDEYLLLKDSSTVITLKTEKNVTIYDNVMDFEKKYQIRRLNYDMDFTKENFSDKDIISTIINTSSFGFSFKEQYLDQNNKSFNIKKYKHISNWLIFNLKDELINFDSFFKPSYIKILCWNRSNNLNLEIEETIKKLELENKENNLVKLIKELTENKNELMKFKYGQKISLQDLDKLKILFELPLQNYFFIDFYNEQDINFSEFSQGERAFYIHFLFLTYMYLNHQKSNEDINTFFLLDEPDTTLHPNWQKKYIKDLINIFKNYSNNIHFIITSHSPFLLSDIPKENVIFLKNGKQENPDIQQTFGANIHTLLSHGFFMEDGLMGEFAKDKISQILFLLSGKIGPINIPQKDIKPIIKIIGEDFLREKLLKMYDEKFPISKEEKIKQLEDELKKLKHG